MPYEYRSPGYKAYLRDKAAIERAHPKPAYVRPAPAVPKTAEELAALAESARLGRAEQQRRCVEERRAADARELAHAERRDLPAEKMTEVRTRHAAAESAYQRVLARDGRES